MQAATCDQRRVAQQRRAAHRPGRRCWPHRTGTRLAPPSALPPVPADPVVSTAWLQQHLDDVSVLDVRGHVQTVVQTAATPPASDGDTVEASTYHADYDAYLSGHIPGAVFFDWTADCVDANAGAPVQLQMQADSLFAALEVKGVSADRPVVAYDGGDAMLAARLWWLLSVAGHPSPLVLEGGWAKWQAEGRAAELYEPCTLKIATFFDAQMRPHLRAELRDVELLLQQASSAQQQQQQQQQQQRVLFLDTRSAEQFTGQVRRGPRAGHIPGAVSLPRRALLADDSSGLLLPLEQQRQLLQQAGVQLPPAGGQQTQQQQTQQQQQRVVVYCNGGVAACTAALALHRLGHRNWCLYDGSWNEYSASSLPVEL